MRSLCFIILLLLSTTGLAQQPFVVGVVIDGTGDRFASQHEQYVDELEVLTAGEFGLEFKRFVGEWTGDSINAAIDQAYADDDVDLVLVTGFVANQLAATRPVFSKPTFLPQIIDTALLSGRSGVGESGVPNLNYLSAYADFADDLDALRRIVQYRELVLFVDAALSSAIPALRERAFAASGERGVQLIEVTHDGVDHDLMKRVPAETDAVFIAGLPRLPPADFDRLIKAINDAGLPSYSFAGVADVERGLLVTNSEPSDVERQARLNALNMQSVMLGERAEDQPTTSQLKEQLTINMATARYIGLFPDFDVLSDAVLLNQDAEVGGEQHGLVDIARLALLQNQDLQAESFGVRAGFEEISGARANLLPQFGASAAYTLRKDSPAVTAGLFAERSQDVQLSVDQLLYSDSASANLVIQKALQQTRLASLEEFELDVVQAATVAYYSVLNARSQLVVQDNNRRITRANLELAEDRVRLGISTRADVYRWQAEEARAQIRVVNARAALNQEWETLNRILHLPQGQRIALREASFDEPSVISQTEFDRMVRNYADYQRFSRFHIDRALEQAPELSQLDSQIAAKDRELLSERRSFWLPEFTVGSRYSRNLGQSGVGAGPQAGEDLNDWSVGIQATLPLFSGGLKKANVSRAEYQLRQLKALRISAAERVEEQVRNQLHAAQAAYQQIELSANAADASRRNFELVSDAYARGTVTVIELLDAQDTSLTASAAAAESLYNFLITITVLQRAVGSYDFLRSEQERNALAAELRMTLTGTR
ncbi:MAG: TolC family protein [Gammaproteobacteria bacterium]|nr:TolC family protein [Gammaproteobacteria bacterium]